MDRGGELRGTVAGSSWVGLCCAAGGMWGEGSRGDAGVDAAVGERCLGGLAAPRLDGAERGAISGDEHAERECSFFLPLTV